MKAKNNINTARSTDSVCNILYVLTPAHTDSSFYLWLSCCDRPQGSISVSHFCSCVQIVPSTRVHQGRLKTITTTWLWKITDTSIFAAKKAKGTNVQSNHPECQEDVERAALLHEAATISFTLKMSNISHCVIVRHSTALIKPWSACSWPALVS